ncbi:MAG: LacI family DNA-binding transcriptional regulator [Rhodoferax sp.]|nr:LacI family DNA-binding transcriptional regulator [Rhodoferax sp.]
MVRRPSAPPPPAGRAGAAVTLRDVALAARTTPMTVSNVINGRKGQVGAEMIARVLAACERLGYRPHASARQLRTQRRMTVGVIIVDPSAHYLSDPFTAAMLAGLNDVLQVAGYSIMLQGASPADLATLPLLRRIESDGICLLTSGAPAQRLAMIQQVAALGQPLVLIQDELPDSISDACALLQDDQGGGAEIARHLFGQACRQAVMLLPAVPWAAMERREAGVRAVLATMPKPPAFHVVHCGDEGFDDTQAAFAQHVARHGLPDVVIGGNDRMAIAAMKYLQAQGCAVPADVRVTGFNGFDFWRYASPELTTVFSPAFQLGEESARALLRRLESGSFPARRRVLPVVFAPTVSSQATARAAPAAGPGGSKRHRNAASARHLTKE